MHLAEPSLHFGVKIKGLPPDSDNHRQLLGKHDLLASG
jgi:hypothetical protein